MLTVQRTDKVYIANVGNRRLLVILGVTTLFLTACSEQASNPFPALDPTNQTSTPLAIVDNGYSAGQNAFSNGCQRIALGIFDGTADVFREAGTMSEEDGYTDLARIAYAYADSLDNFNKDETFPECINY